MSNEQGGASLGRIPFRLRIGVTGHRKLEDEEAVAAAVRRALQQARELLPRSPRTPVLLSVVSPLAEGADRLVAREVLKEPGAQLEAPLPFSRDVYLDDFDSVESKREFEELVRRASLVTEMRAGASREGAYEQVGRYVVERSDVVIAVWDGQESSGRGGTADVVAYARSRGVPLYWIASNGQHEMVVEPRGGVDLEAFDELDRFNRFSIDSARFDQETAAHERNSSSGDERTSSTEQRIVAFSEWVLPYFVRAELLALYYQRRHDWLGSAIFVLAALAVAAVSFQLIFLPEIALVALVELACLVGLLVLVLFGRWRRFGERWIWYRFLAERFRSALFLALVDGGAPREGRPGRIYLGRPPGQWVRRAFAEVWAQRPRTKPADADFEDLRQSLARSWLKEQQTFHERASQKAARRHRQLVVRWSSGLFIATAVAAAIHAFDLVEGRSSGPFDGAEIATFLSIALPGFAAAFAGIGEQREYQRNSQRYEQMQQYLRELGDEMKNAGDLATVRRVAEDTEEVMLRENSDWLVIMGFHDPRLQA